MLESPTSPPASAPVIVYPALYKSANDASGEQQRDFLRIVGAEYALLFIASLLALDFGSQDPGYFALYALVLVGATALLIYRTAKKPEQDWYRFRALAESVKTSTWLYVMQAHPFAHGAGPQAKSAFREYLAKVIDSNRHIGELTSSVREANRQTTLEMEHIRSLNWKERRDIYLIHRIDEQLSWYNKKARINKRAGRNWAIVSGFIYTCALTLAVFRIAYPEWKFWPIDPFLLAASIVIGWVQIKKFNELASVYALTAHEIGLIHGKIADVDNAAEFAEFVNEAELAFSREHTQWVARQANKY
jgi:hypothetical protein